RADGQRPTIFLRIDQDRLAAITDPTNQQTILGYEPDDGGPTSGLLDSVQSPTGAVTVVDYKPLDYPPGVVVKDVRVTDGSGKDVLAERTFSIDPQGNLQHNYTGYPDYQPTDGSDALFDSGDPDYRYSTTLSDGTSTVKSTYNSLHLLVSQEVSVQQGPVMVPSQHQVYTYPRLPSPYSPDHLPGNYAKPAKVALTYYGNTGTRTVTTSSDYNDYGELV